MSALTILALLGRAAQASPDKGLIFLEQDSETTVTYSHLLEIAHKNASLLRAAEVVKPGKIVMMYFDRHSDNVIWFWSIAAAGGIPAVLSSLAHDPKTREAQIANYENIFDEPIVLTSRHLAMHLDPATKMKVFGTSDISLSSGSAKGVPQVENNETRGDDLAVILFTSGSTGLSKAVEFSHAQLIASVAEKKAFHRINCETNFLSWTGKLQSANLCLTSDQAVQHLIIRRTFVKSTSTDCTHARTKSMSQQPTLSASQRNSSIF